MSRVVENYYTIDELSALVKLPRRTIRYYQSQGMLRPPHRAGRVAFYDDDHAKRLRLITSMQDRGLRLDAIRGVLDRMETGGDSLVAWLGLSGRDTGLGPDDRPVLLTSEMLMARLDGDVALIDDLVTQGVVSRQGAALDPVYLVRSLALLDDAVALVRVGVSLETSVVAAELIRSRMETMVDQLVAYHAEYFHDDPRFTDDARLQAALETLRTVSVGVVRMMFAQEMDRAMQALVTGGPTKIDEIAAARPNVDLRRLPAPTPRVPTR